MDAPRKRKEGWRVALETRAGGQQGKEGKNYFKEMRAGGQ